MFWLKGISGNHFTPSYVFGKHRKLGQTEISFCVDCKITLPSRKWISVYILPSNDFHPRKIEEREKQQEEIAPEATPDRTTAPNPRSHRSRRTPAPTRSRRLKHRWDRATCSTTEIAPQHRWDRTHDPPMPYLSLSQSTSPFPSIVNHSLFLPLLRFTEFLSSMNVLFWFLFLLSLLLKFSITKFVVWKERKLLKKCEKLVGK